MDKVFIDTAPVIYLLENSVHPYRCGHPEKVDDLESFANDSLLQVFEVSKEIALYAANLRAKYAGLKAMDSLQLACAVKKNCSVFLTNDKQLRQVDEIKCHLLV